MALYDYTALNSSNMSHAGIAKIVDRNSVARYTPNVSVHQHLILARLGLLE